MKNKVQDSYLVPIVAGSDIHGGDAVAVGAAHVGVAVTDIASGATGVVDLHGVYELPKASGIAVSQGAALYLVSGAITTASGGVPAGTAFEAATSAGATVRVMLNL